MYLAILIGALLFAAPPQDPREAYETKREKLKDDDVRGHFKLAEWCRKKKLWDLALEEYELVLELDPKHRRARKVLGWKKSRKEWKRIEKVAKQWTYRAASTGGITFPDKEELAGARKKGKNYEIVLKILLDPDVWEDAIRSADERTGLFTGKLEIRVSFNTLNGPLARGGGAGGLSGRIEIDIDRMAEQIDHLAKYKRGGLALPPSPIHLVLKHELVHCFEGTGGPGWLREGMPCFVAQDPHVISYYQYDKVKTESIEAKINTQYNYARGWAFLEHLEKKYRRDKVKIFLKLVFQEGKSVSEAAEEATGAKWKDLIRAEQRWSASWLRKYKIKK